MKKYISVGKGFLLERMVYKFSLFFNAAEKYIYIVLVFFLWGAIYKSLGDKSLSMNFEETFTYLSLATAIFGLFQTWVDWDISQLMIKGDISIVLTKPVDFQVYMLFKRLPWVILNFFTITFPTLVLLIFVFNMPINKGINVLFFFISIVISYLIYFSIDFIVGVTAFYTESVWGLSMAKDAIISFFSGGVIPLPLFPEGLRKVSEFLPFKTIYDMPIEILVNKNLNIENITYSLGVQIFWLLVIFSLSRFYYRRAEMMIKINGG